MYTERNSLDFSSLGHSRYLRSRAPQPSMGATGQLAQHRNLREYTVFLLFSFSKINKAVFALLHTVVTRFPAPHPPQARAWSGRSGTTEAEAVWLSHPTDLLIFPPPATLSFAKNSYKELAKLLCLLVFPLIFSFKAPLIMIFQSSST